MFVGIDVSNDALDVEIRPGPDAWQVRNDAEGIEALSRRLRGLSPELVVRGATRAYDPGDAAGGAESAGACTRARAADGMDISAT